MGENFSVPNKSTYVGEIDQIQFSCTGKIEAHIWAIRYLLHDCVSFQVRYGTVENAVSQSSGGTTVRVNVGFSSSLL